MIPRRLNEAAKAITRRLAVTRLVAHGLVAISVGRALTGGEGVLRVNSSSDLMRTLLGHLKRLDDLYVNPWFRGHPGTEIAGVIVQLDYVAYMPNSPIVSGCQMDWLARSPR
jgi:hypothetical protein